MMRISGLWRAPIFVGVVAALSIAGIVPQASARFTIPRGARPVHVTAGASTRTVNALMNLAGEIDTTVTDASSGGNLADANVIVFDVNTLREVARKTTDFNGNVQLKGLRSGRYYVCVLGDVLQNPRYGHVGRCYGGATQFVSRPTSDAAPVFVTATQVRTIGVALDRAGAISGQVFAAVTGHGIGSVDAIAYAGSRRIASITTDRGGRFRLAGLDPSVTYQVCFAPYGVTGGGSPTSYLPACWPQAAWGGPGTAPPGAGTVGISADRTSSGIDTSLSSAGAISGSVVSAAAGHPAVRLSKVVVSRNGRVAAATHSADNGSYHLRGLPAGSYRVCAQGGRRVQQAFGRWCRSVTVRLRSTRSGADFRLPMTRLGAVAGRVSYGGQVVHSVAISMFNGTGHLVTSGFTADDGTYRIDRVRPSRTGYRICFDTHYASATTTHRPVDGLASQCWTGASHGIAWTGGSTPAPSGAHGVPIAAGRTRRGIDAAFVPGGAIQGRVTREDTERGLIGVDVYVFDASGRFVSGGTSSGRDALYKVPDLTPGSYRVCFAARYLDSGLGWLDQCYSAVDWRSGP